MSGVRVGLSGFAYKPWQGEGRFYPPGLSASRFLEYYAERYDVVESDGTWYRMPSESTLDKWIRQTPDGFWFCPKMHRDVTHTRRLKPESYEVAHRFVESLQPLAKVGRLGPILVQLPPNFRRDDARLKAFLDALPKTMFAFEFRHESWRTTEVASILRAGGAALVAADTDEYDAPKPDSDRFGYVRLRKSTYNDERLAIWADRLRSRSAPAVVFFKHEDEGSPWVWADGLRARLSDPVG